VNARSRPLYLLLVAAVIGLGLLSRSRPALEALPPSLAKGPGDALWATMVFLGLGVLRPRATTRANALLALAFAYAIEIGQLWHAPWLDAIRSTTPGHLVLGRGFAAADFAWYALGVGLGAALELLACRPRPGS
jgi:hypothetical protein